MALGVAHQGSTHHTPNTSHLIWKVADKACELNILTFDPHRVGSSPTKSHPDLMAVGEAKLHSLSLAMFNKKLQGLIAGTLHMGDEFEVDELPALGLNITVDKD